MTDSTMTTRDLLASILDGAHDADLDALSSAITDRRKAVRDREARINAAMLKPGARVTLKGLSPKSLNGATVEVVKVKKTRVDVKAVEDVTPATVAARIGFHGQVSVPLSCVEPVAEA